MAKDGKGIAGDGIGKVVGPIHDKLYIRGNHTELSNHEFIAREFEVVPDIPVKVLNAPKIVVIGIFPNTDIRSFNQVLQKA